MNDLIIGFMVFSMVVVLILAWRWFGSLRTAFLVMLIVGKIWAGVLWAFGIDRPLFNIIIYNKLRGATSSITITADQFVFLSFLFSFMLVVSWPYIERYLPEPIRRLEVIRGGRRE